MLGSQLTRFSALLSAHLRQNLSSLLLAACGIVGYALTEILAPWPLKLILDQILLAKPFPAPLQFLEAPVRSRPEAAVVVIATAILLIALLKGAFSYLQVFVTSRVGYQMVHKLRQALFSHVQRLSLSFHNRSRAGELLTKVTSDTAVLKDIFAGGLLELLGHIVSLVGMCTVLFLLNARLALIVAVTLPLLAWTILSIYRRSKNSARRQREREGRVAAHIGEVLSLTPLVRAFAREQLEEERFERESSSTLAESIRTARVEAAAGRTVEVINAAGVWAVVLFGGLLALRREITPGDLLVFSSYLTSMYKPLRNIAKLITQYSKAMASAERIEQLLATEADEANRPGGIDPGPLSGDIVFDNIHFGYDAATPVLRGLSLRIRAGEHVALAGASGAGKSTIASLLLRFYRPQSGAVRVDGRNIDTFEAEAYRRQIGVVLQDSLLFGATVAENIAYGKPGATREEIEAAARRAGAHDFISALPAGYDTVLNERASTLSGGQRQRLCLTRAFLKEPPLLILDEPTAAIDAESAALIHRSIHELQRGKTAIMIAHHFHQMDQFDRIVVLKDGTVAEEGTHAQLLALGGAYAELYQLQQQQQQKETSEETVTA